MIDIFLQPGEFLVADADYRIRTLLGSCVSITLWHRTLRAGAMSHFLLPERGGPSPGQALDGRYGDEALRLMLAQLATLGIAPSQCEGKVFGGGDMFPQQARAGASNVGQRNGEAACALLGKFGIPIVSQSLFGIGHRQIIFDVGNGDVWSHQVRPIAQEVQASTRDRLP